MCSQSCTRIQATRELRIGCLSPSHFFAHVLSSPQDALASFASFDNGTELSVCHTLLLKTGHKEAAEILPNSQKLKKKESLQHGASVTVVQSPIVLIRMSLYQLIDHSSVRSGSSPDSPSQIIHHHSIPPPPPPNPHHHPYHHHLQPGSMSPTYHHHLNHLHHQGFFSYDPSNFQVFVDNSVHPMARMDAVVKNECEFKTHSEIEAEHMSSDPHSYHHHHNHHQHDQQSMNGSDPSSPQQTAITAYQTDVTGTTGSRPVPARSPYEWMSSNKKCNSTSSGGGGGGGNGGSGSSQPAPGKTRTRDKYRVVYSDHQRVELEKEFLYSKYITIRRKAELAVNLALSERQVKIWFQNRRAKARKLEKKREENNKKDHCKNSSNSENNNGNNSGGSNNSSSMSLHPMYLTGNSIISSGTPGPGTTLIDHMRDHSGVRGSPDSPSSLMHHHHHSIIPASAVPPPPSHAYHHAYHHHMQSNAPVPVSPPLTTHHLNHHLHHQAGLFPYVNEPNLQVL